MQFMHESLIPNKLDYPGSVKYIGINFQSLTNREKLEQSIITEYLPNGSLKEIQASAEQLEDGCFTGIRSLSVIVHPDFLIYTDFILYFFLVLILQ